MIFISVSIISSIMSFSFLLIAVIFRVTIFIRCLSVLTVFFIFYLCFVSFVQPHGFTLYYRFPVFSICSFNFGIVLLSYVSFQFYCCKLFDSLLSFLTLLQLFLAHSNFLKVIFWFRILDSYLNFDVVVCCTGLYTISLSSL